MRLNYFLFAVLLPSLSLAQTVPLDVGPARPELAAPAAPEGTSAVEEAPALGLGSFDSLEAGDESLSLAPAAAAVSLSNPLPLPHAGEGRGEGQRAVGSVRAESINRPFPSPRPSPRLSSGRGRGLQAPPVPPQASQVELRQGAETWRLDSLRRLAAAEIPAVGVEPSVPLAALHAAPETEYTVVSRGEKVEIIPPAEEKKPLGLLHLTLLGVNTIVGSGVFLMPGKMAKLLGPASIVPFAVVGLMLTTVGLCFAEASTYFKKNGGPYQFARAAFGEWPGYAIGWMTWVCYVFSWATVASAISNYLAVFSTAFSSVFASKSIAVGVVAFMSFLNYLGAKQGAKASSLFTAAKLIPLALFVALGLFHIFTHGASYIPFAPHGWVGLGAACSSAFFAFQGFEAVPVPAGKVDQPAKNVPRAVLLSLLIAGVLYMAVQSVAVGAFPGLAESHRPLADAARHLVGPAGAGVMALGAVISMTGFNAGTALVAPDMLTALAHDGHVPSGLAKQHSRFGSPSRAIAVTFGVVAAMILLLDFSKLVDFTNVVVCAQYLAACLSVPFLRKKLAAPAGAFRLPGGWTIPLLGIGATLWLGSQGGLAQVWWALGILGFGLAVRAFRRK